MREFTTTEKDVDKGISRIPLALARLLEEDVLEEEDSSSMLVDPPEILDDYTTAMEYRSQAYSQSRGNSAYNKTEDENSRERSSTIFSKSSIDNLTFEDF